MARVTKKWNRTDTLVLANSECATCCGVGITSDKGNACVCVLRRVFKLCYERFKDCHLLQSNLACSSLESSHRQNALHRHGMRREEYMTDFVNVAQKALQDSPVQAKLFKYHYLLGADSKMCARRLGLSPVKFHAAAYIIEQKLGRVFRELEPYALFPLDEYFSAGCANRMEERYA